MAVNTGIDETADTREATAQERPPKILDVASVVGGTDASAHQPTVMLHSHDASIAGPTMMCACSLDEFALLAKRRLAV